MTICIRCKHHSLNTRGKPSCKLRLSTSITQCAGFHPVTSPQITDRNEVFEKPKHERYIADGIGFVEEKAFQSFITRHWYGVNKRTITVPSRIAKHLSLHDDDILEIAIRKVTKQYAKDNYGIDFFSFRTICPKCQQLGVLIKLKPYSFFINHARLGQVHYITKEVAQKLIEEHEKQEVQA